MGVDIMHLHKSLVVRSYLFATEDDSYHADAHNGPPVASAVPTIRWFVIDNIDVVDVNVKMAARVGDFRLAFSYVDHLRIFLFMSASSFSCG